MAVNLQLKNSLQNSEIAKPGQMMQPSAETSETERLLPNNDEKKGFPFRVLFILGNEFCERYAFYGMRTILILYLNYYILWDEDTSTAVYHAFNVMCYLFPLIGAIIADGWWGKYRTILWLSIVYAIGMVLNTLGAVNTLGDLKTHIVLSAIGLFVIAIGTGGIKPCVAAFGGDQFDRNQEKYRLKFFSLFYFAINAGSLISTFATPLIRENIKCFGTDCYPLAFGIPAILMFISLILFVGGTRWYRIIPPTGDIFTQVAKVIFTAIKVRWNTPRKERAKNHWLDYAETPENGTIIRDVKYVLNVLVLFIPLPLFWTLYDQQGSRWTLQAVRMNGYVGSVQILPDQMLSCNPILILLLIPFSETVIYPGLRKLNIEFRPLQRMTVGMLLAGLSFIVAAFVHMKIDVNLTPIPQTSSESTLRVINAADCNLVVNSNVYPDWLKPSTNESLVEGGLNLKPGETSNTAGVFATPGQYQVMFACNDSNSMDKVNVALQSLVAYDMYISKDGNDSLKYLFDKRITKKSDDAKAIVSIVNTLNIDMSINLNTFISSNTKTTLKEMRRGSYMLNVVTTAGNKSLNYTVDTGGIYTLMARMNDTGTDIIIDNYTDVNPNDVNIFWMIPQYFIITLGEIFLSITALSFAYSQAPPSMKSILQSFWLLTVSVGNIVVLIVAEARLIDSQTNEYFLFAGLIGIAAIVFVILAHRYKYVDESEFENQTVVAQEDDINEYK